MPTIHIDPAKVVGKIKPMHAVNNGVVMGRQNNFASYKAAGFPYARNHDASYNEEYGVEHTVDITAIFRDFSADPYAPASYDFPVTDAYLASTIEAGTKIFYRLGQRIEHTVKKYNVYPPADYRKWAVICEHIIRPTPKAGQRVSTTTSPTGRSGTSRICRPNAGSAPVTSSATSSPRPLPISRAVSHT